MGSNVGLIQGGRLVTTDNPVPVGGQQYQVSAEVVIGGNATYALGKVVGPTVAADTTIAGCARVAGGSGIIIKARLITNNVLTVGGLAQFRVHFYDDAAGVVTAIADQTANTVMYANGTHRVGSIDFTNFITGGSGSDSAVSYGVHQGGNASHTPFKCAAGATALSYRIEALAAPVLTTGQKFTLILMILPDVA